MNFKKSILLSVIVISINTIGVIAQDFITTWQTTTGNESITIPTSGGGYIYLVDWGDGSNDTIGYTGNASHIYATAGIYIVSISGCFPRIAFAFSSDNDKIRSIEQWGGQVWTSMNYAFYNCSNLVINATDVPNLSYVTDLSGMFHSATSINQDISNWDVSNITNMNAMFHGATAFNQDISDWDVSNVTNMGVIFYGATAFNQALSSWDVSSVTNMFAMFKEATAFNQAISGWDVSNVTDMTAMFQGATAFNQALTSWNVSNVTEMINMFAGATAFNQDISQWNVSHVISLSGMFTQATAFNQDLSLWDVSNVTDMSWMFSSATSFNQDISAWDVSSVNSMHGMFYEAVAFNQDISTWNVSSVTDMCWMFKHAYAFNQDISGWNVSNVTSMKELFRSTPFNQDISGWDVSNVNDMSWTFVFASAFNQDLSNWDVSSVTSMVGMFESATSFNQDISGWDVSNVTDMRWIFAGAQSFNQNLSGWDISNITSMTSMFSQAKAFNQDLSGWDVSNITDMRSMFNGASSFNQDISSWDISNVTDMEYMLSWCNLSMTNYDLLLQGWATQDVQSGVILGAQDLKYCEGYNARTTLISKGWNFIGDEGGCPQYIIFDPLDTKTMGDAPFELTATASSGLPVGFWSSDENVATIDGNIATIVGAGSVVISAYQDGGSGYAAAESVNQSLTVNKGDQIITFGPLANKTIGDAAFDLTATASSGLVVGYSSSDETVATVSGNTVTIVKAGSTTITASQAGNDNYNAAASVDQVLTINKADQTITFGPLDTKTVIDDPFELSATASSGLDISYTSSDETIATIAGNILNIVGVGSATITAGQAGNTYYYPAPSVDQVLTVNKADQSIVFNPLASSTYGDTPFALTATASSGLDVSFSSSDETVATIDGNNLTIVGAGSTTITASQAGNDNYNTATNVDQVLNVNKADQSITFDPLSASIYDDAPFTLSASASSGLNISYSSSDGTVALVGGNTVTIVGVGSAIIKASQEGNDNYNAATPVDQVLTVDKADQTITFGPLNTKKVIDVPFDLSATASSGLDISYSSSDEGIATIDGNTVTILSVGTTTITARQAGNDNYNAADSVNQILTIDKADQTITFGLLPAKILGDDPFELTATATSGLDVSYSSSDGTVATVDGTTVTIHGAGTTTITASQDGNDLYYPATPVDQFLVVNTIEALLSVKQAKMSFYPNPASDYIIIQATADVERIEIVDMNGRLKGTQEHSCQIDISHLITGMYLLKVCTEDNVYIGKFIKR